MKVGGTHYQTIWLKPDDPTIVQIIDQRRLPHEFVVLDLRTVAEVAHAIQAMIVRGAGLIGVTAAYGMYIAVLTAPKTTRHAFWEYVEAAGAQLKATRPTAVNLAWAVDRQLEALQQVEPLDEMIACARETALRIAAEDAENCRNIGTHGLQLIEALAERKPGETINILTHCNAGWLAFVDYGSATAPIYAAHDRGLPVHVWVDETRPRNQGARLTAWELGQHGVPHTVIADNVGGHLMQHGLVDLCIVGSDRTTVTGDVANKIGTYLKALAAHDNGVPFYVALPSSSFDWDMRDGLREIPIEQRGGDEVKYMDGQTASGAIEVVRLTPESSPVANFGFDVTPARLVTGLITERGVVAADEDAILNLYPEKRRLASR
ncbi:MAG: S-methyl-5-thioribose-1-phosphate isomerase [Chloroflexi bacterium]|uniref:S-methyl-5-thioribose-1-phosphate isomerase n=1 Tax=Candidatus Flexifilum breve TaxID=3140694 RepID=UPI003135FABE|nr:S-methyl-5-thioribose-1-phosphate isomerase [Chloroflexota bacterium]